MYALSTSNGLLTLPKKRRQITHKSPSSCHFCGLGFEMHGRIAERAENTAKRKSDNFGAGSAEAMVEPGIM
jgi:hypothetical protein